MHITIYILKLIINFKLCFTNEYLLVLEMKLIYILLSYLSVATEKNMEDYI